MNDLLGDAASTVEAQAAEISRLRDALKPFAEFGARNTDEDGWRSNIHREGISVWFGPSEFRDAKTALNTLEVENGRS
jgi:hypothetical protein